LNAGVCGFGLGSNIVDKKLLEANDYEAITLLAEKYVSEVM
jgi:2-keto-3-deoxy-6-phosphogluconate aldolase